jgi:hypothetical protein
LELGSYHLFAWVSLKPQSSWSQSLKCWITCVCHHTWVQRLLFLALLFSSKYRVLLGLVAKCSNPNTQEAEAGESQVQD